MDFTSLESQKFMLWDHKQNDKIITIAFDHNRQMTVVISTKILDLASKYFMDNTSIFDCLFIGKLENVAGKIKVLLNRIECDIMNYISSNKFQSSDEIFVPVKLSKDVNKIIEDKNYLRFFVKEFYEHFSKCSNLFQLPAAFCMCITGVFDSNEKSKMFNWIDIKFFYPDSKFYLTPIKAVYYLKSTGLNDFDTQIIDGKVQFSFGYLGINVEKQVLFYDYSDESVTTEPIVGMWIFGISDMYDIRVTSACLRFILAENIQSRLCKPPLPFLLAHIKSSSEIDFYDVKWPMGPSDEYIDAMDTWKYVKFKETHGKDNLDRYYSISCHKNEVFTINLNHFSTKNPANSCYSSLMDCWESFLEKDLPRDPNSNSYRNFIHNQDDIVPRQSIDVFRKSAFQFTNSRGSPPLVELEVPDVSLVMSESSYGDGCKINEKSRKKSDDEPRLKMTCSVTTPTPKVNKTNLNDEAVPRQPNRHVNNANNQMTYQMSHQHSNPINGNRGYMVDMKMAQQQHLQNHQFNNQKIFSSQQMMSQSPYIMHPQFPPPQPSPYPYYNPHPPPCTNPPYTNASPHLFYHPSMSIASPNHIQTDTKKLPPAIKKTALSSSGLKKKGNTMVKVSDKLWQLDNDEDLQVLHELVERMMQDRKNRQTNNNSSAGAIKHQVSHPPKFSSVGINTEFMSSKDATTETDPELATNSMLCCQCRQVLIPSSSRPSCISKATMTLISETESRRSSNHTVITENSVHHLSGSNSNMFEQEEDPQHHQLSNSKEILSTGNTNEVYQIQIPSANGDSKVAAGFHESLPLQHTDRLDDTNETGGSQDDYTQLLENLEEFVEEAKKQKHSLETNIDESKEFGIPNLVGTNVGVDSCSIMKGYSQDDDEADNTSEIDGLDMLENAVQQLRQLDLATTTTSQTLASNRDLQPYWNNITHIYDTSLNTGSYSHDLRESPDSIADKSPVFDSSPSTSVDQTILLQKINYVSLLLNNTFISSSSSSSQPLPTSSSSSSSPHKLTEQSVFIEKLARKYLNNAANKLSATDSSSTLGHPRLSSIHNSSHLPRLPNTCSHDDSDIIVGHNKPPTQRHNNLHTSTPHKSTHRIQPPPPPPDNTQYERILDNIHHGSTLKIPYPLTSSLDIIEKGNHADNSNMEDRNATTLNSADYSLSNNTVLDIKKLKVLPKYL